MNMEIANKWTAALRSGDFEQGQGCLHQQDDEGDRLCCLGVLVHLAIDEGVEDIPIINLSEDGDDVQVFAYDGDSQYLPYTIKSWAGMKSDTGSRMVLNEPFGRSLVQLNDQGWSFAQIADHIDKYAEEL